MPKVFIHLKGISTSNNKWDMDSVIIHPRVRIPYNQYFEVTNGTKISFSSMHGYMGVINTTGKALLKATEGAPIVRVSTPSGSYVEGEIEVESIEGKLDVREVKKNIDAPQYKSNRRIIK